MICMSTDPDAFRDAIPWTFDNGDKPPLFNLAKVARTRLISHRRCWRCFLRLPTRKWIDWKSSHPRPSMIVRQSMPPIYTPEGSHASVDTAGDLEKSRLCWILDLCKEPS